MPRAHPQRKKKLPRLCAAQAIARSRVTYCILAVRTVMVSEHHDRQEGCESKKRVLDHAPPNHNRDPYSDLARRFSHAPANVGDVYRYRHRDCAWDRTPEHRL